MSNEQPNLSEQPDQPDQTEGARRRTPPDQLPIDENAEPGQTRHDDDEEPPEARRTALPA
jgi:hypothetical protein